ncbi:sensor histidine kinase [Patulibacter minatonensis]|uniref:sensor histidine kinase n=1 Tax=Patulibacter minatonensis TaxID=298163 RepID=UPI00047AD646|nr:sensor histidine kinase [Patulibacter minatonensis]
MLQDDATPPPLADRLRHVEPPAFGAIQLALLLISTVLAAATDDPSDGRLAAELGLSALAAVWVLVGWRWRRPQWSVATPAGTAHFVVLLVLTGALVALSPLYGFFAWTGYLFVVRAAKRRRFLLAVAPVAMISAWSQTGGTAGDSAGDLAVWVLLAVVNTAVAGTVIWFSWVGKEQDEHRRRALADLTVAHAELERSAAENAALQQRLVEQAREAGIQDERGRMAREIHDTLAQGLVGIVTQLEAAEQADERGGDWRRHHRTAVAMAREGLTEARRSVDALRPEALQDARLPDALADVAREWSARHEVRVEVTTTGDARPLRPEVEVTLLRTAQEALANVARHASADRVGLTLSYMGDQVTLDVRDDGVGFDPEACARELAARDGRRADGRNGDGSHGPTATEDTDGPHRPTTATGDTAGPHGPTTGAADPDARRTADGDPPRDRAAPGHEGGYGLIAMRERVAGLDGTLEIESEPGGGVALSATVPARFPEETA